MRDKERKYPLSSISTGVILIILAVTYILHPISISLFVDYTTRMGELQTFIKPPSVLLNPLVFFFNAIGVWQLVLSGFRIVFQQNVRKALGDLTGALFSLGVAFLLSNYATDVLSGRTLLAYFLVGVGVFIIVNAVVYFAFPERRFKEDEKRRNVQDEEPN